MSSGRPRRVAVVAPGGAVAPDVEPRVLALAAERRPELEIVFHPHVTECWGHFAGTDEVRLQALVDAANDPDVDAVWFARGGYGACRIAEDALAAFGPEARRKSFLGYSDIGFLLAGLHRAGFPHVFHGPMPGDIRREGGEAAVARALGWLADRDPAGLEPSLADGRPAYAFNLVILSQLLGTPLEPDFTDRVLMIEEVGEHMYRIDRHFWHVTSNPAVRRCAGIMLGRCDPVLPNEPEFGRTEEDVARYWCERSGIPWLGRADIGHDVNNKIVPFG